MKPKDYDAVLISARYSIWKNKIYYFYKDAPYPEGILEAENLLEQDDVEANLKS
jgi:hypothetical protein